MQRLCVCASLIAATLAIHDRRSAVAPSAENAQLRQASGEVQHLTLENDVLTATYRPFEFAAASDGTSRRLIPSVLHFTGKDDTIEKMSLVMQMNVKNGIKENAGFTVKYWGDKACRKYLKQYYDERLGALFDDAPRGLYGGAYRGDICRAAVLYREGGFYMDTDIQLAVPLLAMVDASTSFMGVRHSNMMMAAKPFHPILASTLRQIPRWYSDFDAGRFTGLLGPATLERGFLMACKCGMNCFPSVRKFRCGNHVVQLFNEKMVDCRFPSKACPFRRMYVIRKLAREKKSLTHLLWGIVGETGNDVVGWSRFDLCAERGCGGTGYMDKDWVDMDHEAKVTAAGYDTASPLIPLASADEYAHVPSITLAANTSVVLPSVENIQARRSRSPSRRTRSTAPSVARVPLPQPTTLATLAPPAPQAQPVVRLPVLQPEPPAPQEEVRVPII